MSTQSRMTIEHALRVYSIDADSWWDGMGDADQMLSAREWLQAHSDRMNAAQMHELFGIDQKVSALAAQFQADDSWDIMMLRKTAALATGQMAHA